MKIKNLLENNQYTKYLITVLRIYFVYPLYFLKDCIKVKIYVCRPKYKGIIDLRDTKEGKSCIIVGNGPSVKMSDLDLISQSGIDSFGVNRIIDVFDSTKWRPTYLCVMDPGFILSEKIRTHTPEVYAREIEKYELQQVFFTHALEGVMPKMKNCVYIFSPLANAFGSRLMPFSTDPSVYVSDLGNVTAYSIQIACFLGYKKIYLYGVDGTYPKYLDVDGKFKLREIASGHVVGMKTNSFDESCKSVAKTKVGAFIEGGYADARKENKGYNMCKEFAKKNGVRIINLTHSGAVENFERQNFYDVFGDKNGEDK